MAIVNCPECDKEVAEKARDCPHCGHRLNKPKRSIIGKICLWVFILFNIGMPIWVISACSASATAESSAEAVGVGLAGVFLVIVWLVGSIILGIPALLTRAK